MREGAYSACSTAARPRLQCSLFYPSERRAKHNYEGRWGAAPGPGNEKGLHSLAVGLRLHCVRFRRRGPHVRELVLFLIDFRFNLVHRAVSISFLRKLGVEDR